jgi:hypothetical protein
MQSGQTQFIIIIIIIICLWLNVVFYPQCAYLYLHCAVSVIALVAIGSEHE